MQKRLFALFTFILFTVTLTSGCLEPRAVSIEDTLPPNWEIGDSWSYYSTDATRWENWSVVKIEEYQNWDTYRVEIKSSEKDRFGVSEANAWLEFETLGFVKVREGDGFEETSDFPTRQVFPLENHSYRATTNSGGYRVPSEIEHTIGSVSAIQTGQGRLSAIHVHEYDSLNNHVVYSGWYSPEVGFFAQYTFFDETFVLMDCSGC